MMKIENLVIEKVEKLKNRSMFYAMPDNELIRIATEMVKTELILIELNKLQVTLITS